MSDWKQEHANESEKALVHPLVVGVIDELVFNLNTESKFVRYGIMKVAMYAAQVARAQALGIDPDSLRSTPEEVTEAQMGLSLLAVTAGKDVFFVRPERDS